MDDVHAMTLRLEAPLFERLRSAAFQRNVSRSDLVRESLEAHLAEIEAEAASGAP